MNCRHCHTPLQTSAHFCPKCGASIKQSVPPASREGQTKGSVSPLKPIQVPDGPTQPISPYEDLTQLQKSEPPIITPTPPIPPEAWPQRPATSTVPPTQPVDQAAWQRPSVPPTQPVTSSWAGSPQPAQAQPQEWAASANPAWAQPGTFTESASDKKKRLKQSANPQGRPRRRGRGCLGCLTTLIILLLLLGTGWYFLLRPYVHDIAQARLDNAFAQAVTQIPEEIALAPTLPVSVRENAFTNMITLNLAPSDPIQKPTTQITPAGIRVELQVYGIPIAVSGIPKAVDGKLIATNVSVEGIAVLVMSNEEMTALLNKHLAQAQKRLQHSVTSVTLKEDEVVLLLGPQ